MTFEYLSRRTWSPIDGLPEEIGRPVVPVTVVGPRGAESMRGILDTGSDQTIFPAALARRLGIELREAPPAGMATASGEAMALSLGAATLRLRFENETPEWSGVFLFHEFADRDAEMAILGHAGFLDYFTATFNGELGNVTLVPNNLLRELATATASP